LRRWWWWSRIPSTDNSRRKSIHNVVWRRIYYKKFLEEGILPRGIG
jgi:hypothetical protein